MVAHMKLSLKRFQKMRNKLQIFVVQLNPPAPRRTSKGNIYYIYVESANQLASRRIKPSSSRHPFAIIIPLKSATNLQFSPFALEIVVCPQDSDLVHFYSCYIALKLPVILGTGGGATAAQCNGPLLLKPKRNPGKKTKTTKVTNDLIPSVHLPG